MKPISITILITIALTGCQTSGVNTDVGARSVVPDKALSACSSRADRYQNAAAGTSVINGGQPTEEGNWQVRLTTGSFRSTCTVTPGGTIIDFEPG
jgi:hypothetical protein